MELICVDCIVFLSLGVASVFLVVHIVVLLLDALPSPGVNPLEGSSKCSCGKFGTRKVLLTSSTIEG